MNVHATVGGLNGIHHPQGWNCRVEACILEQVRDRSDARSVAGKPYDADRNFSNENAAGTDQDVAFPFPISPFPDSLRLETATMWYDRTVDEIRQITLWLESTDEEGWADWTASALKTLREVERMAAPKVRPDKGPAQIVQGNPNLRLALPHVQAMVSAMQRTDRPRALASGTAALAEL